MAVTAVLWAIPLSLFLRPVCCWGCCALSAAVAHLGAHISPEVTPSCFSHANIMLWLWLCKSPSVPMVTQVCCRSTANAQRNKNLFLTLLQTQLPLDSPNTSETVQTTSLMLPAQLPISISIRRRSEFANTSGLGFLIITCIFPVFVLFFFLVCTWSRSLKWPFSHPDCQS